MTREQIIECIFKNEDTISCPNTCELKRMEFYVEPWDVSCRRCAKKQLVEYEQKIKEEAREKAIDECIEIFRYIQFYHFPMDDETIDYYISLKLGIIEKFERLKEQKE